MVQLQADEEFGVVKDDKGNTFTGILKNGKKHQGVEEFAVGAKFEGTWEHGQF